MIFLFYNRLLMSVRRSRPDRDRVALERLERRGNRRVRGSGSFARDEVRSFGGLGFGDGEGLSSRSRRKGVSRWLEKGEDERADCEGLAGGL